MKKFKIGLLLCIGLSLVSCAKKPEEQTQEIPTPVIEEKVEDTLVSFMGVGDDLIHGAIYTDALMSDGTYDFMSMYENVAVLAKNSDIAFINQETMLGGSELGLSSYPMFSSPTEIAKNLEASGFTLANLATNHSLDIGSAGIQSTLNAFNETNIHKAGIYSDQESSETIVVFEEQGIRFSFLAYTYGTNGLSATYPYEVSYLDEVKIRKDVAKAKQLSDVVIVSAHWGDENVFTPNLDQEYYAQLFADLDVDVVVGTHPHVIQPVEWKKGASGHRTLVIYSLGNFIGAMADVNNAIGGCIQFDFVKDGNTGLISIENVKWQTLVTHFERVHADTLDGSRAFKVYLLEDYNEELATRHALTGYEGQILSIPKIEEVVRDVIDEQFR